MTSSGKNGRLAEVVRLFGTLRDLYEQLLSAFEGKLQALRRADLTGMSAWSAKERAVAGRLEERLGFRRQLMEHLGPELGVTPGDARRMTVSQLAAHVAGAERSRLVGAAEALRGMVFQVSQANRVLDAASRELLHHVQWVMASVRPRGDAPSTYSGRGTRQECSGACLMETVV